MACGFGWERSHRPLSPRVEWLDLNSATSIDEYTSAEVYLKGSDTQEKGWRDTLVKNIP